MSEKPITILVLVLVAIAVTLYLASQSTPHATQPMGGGAFIDDFGPAPDISMPIGPNGKRVDLSSLHGHVVMLDFWATWCEPCKMSIPVIENIYKKHRAEGLEVVGISTDELSNRADVASAARTLGMTYPFALIGDVPDAQSKYQFVSIPLLLVIDKKGIIRERVNGYDPNGNDEEFVTKLLKEK